MGMTSVERGACTRSRHHLEGACALVLALCDTLFRLAVPQTDCKVQTLHPRGEERRVRARTQSPIQIPVCMYACVSLHPQVTMDEEGGCEQGGEGARDTPQPRHRRSLCSTLSSSQDEPRSTTVTARTGLRARAGVMGRTYVQTRLCTSISMHLRKTHRQAHAGAASTAPSPPPSPSRVQRDIGTAGTRASSPSPPRLHLHIPVDHLRAPLRLHPHPHHQLQLFRDARKMDKCALASASWLRAGRGWMLKVPVGRGNRLRYSKRLGEAREDVHRLHQNVKRRCVAPRLALKLRLREKPDPQCAQRTHTATQTRLYVSLSGGNSAREVADEIHAIDTGEDAGRCVGVVEENCNDASAKAIRHERWRGHGEDEAGRLTAHSFSGLDVETALQNAFYSVRWMHRETMEIETTTQRMRVIAVVESLPSQVASVRTVTKTRAEKRRAILIDLARHRLPRETYETRVAVILFHLPPILIGAISAVYCVLSIKSFYHSRSQFRLLLSASAHANLELDRYLRLMALAATDLLLTVPLASFVLYSNRVVQVPGIYWHTDLYSAASVETLRWATVACALLFFGYFGFADEAIKNYRGAVQSVARRIGYSTRMGSGSGLSSTGTTFKSPLSSSHGGASATLPVFI
ncbi:pheromone A receptor-domain-containing protein [Mycena leptocephala]|nr:pheromone A receptor-domain-containing protein [Mycena leptocephala]